MAVDGPWDSSGPGGPLPGLAIGWSCNVLATCRAGHLTAMAWAGLGYAFHGLG